MGLIFIEKGIPVLFAIYVAYRVCRFWYLRVFPKTIGDIKEVRKASKKFDKELDDGMR